MAGSSQHAKELFLSALDLPGSARAAFLTEACGDDAALRKEVESLLEFHEAANDSASTAAPPGDAQVVFRPGEVFAGRYRMIERLGTGGMGDVWRAEDLVLDTEVALKVIQSTSPAAREGIFREVRLARQITHPAVCRVFDVGESDGVIFFSMELVKGEDLAALLRRVGRVPAQKVIEIGLQLCAGLAAAHAQGVLHRDLKPANILIDDAGLVRISDFGIAIPANRGHTVTRSRARWPIWRPNSARRGWLCRNGPTYAWPRVTTCSWAPRPASGEARRPGSPPRDADHQHRPAA
jgi:serine/threonine protein kinase